jgi:hypothetical protein
MVWRSTEPVTGKTLVALLLVGFLLLGAMPAAVHATTWHHRLRVVLVRAFSERPPRLMRADLGAAGTAHLGSAPPLRIAGHGPDTPFRPLPARLLALVHLGRAPPSAIGFAGLLPVLR